MPEDDDEVRRAIRLLEGVMRVEGISKRGLDEKLGKAPGYFAQVLSGRLELKFRHILGILRALGVEPRVFFRALYPEPGEPEGSVRMMGRYLEEMERHRPVRPPAGPAAAFDPEELDRRIRAAVRDALAEVTGREGEPGPA